jgi:hypothetical protein
LRALVAGQITNALAPIRAGEAVRVGVLAAHGDPLALTVASVAGVKVVDAIGLAVIAILLVGAAVPPAVGLIMASGVAIALGTAGLACRAQQVRGWLLARAGFGRSSLAALVSLAESLKDRRTLLAILATSLVVWGAGVLANGAVLAAAGLSPRLDLAARMLVAGYLVGLAPAPPLRLGVFEAGIVVVLSPMGIPVPDAILVGLTLHACLLAELGLLLVASFVVVPRWSWRA